MKTYILSPIRLNLNTDTLYGKLRSVGGNSGNMVFINAMRKQIDSVLEIDITWDDFNMLKGATVVMPSSNFIRHVKNDLFFSNFKKFVDKIDGTFTLAGLGAQSSKVFTTPRKLIKYGINEDQKSFFKAVSEKAVSIGVRGEFTAECLELMGIHNYRIIGCPSYFNTLDGSFPYIKKPEAGNVQMTVTSGKRKNCRILDFGLENKCYWVMQSASEIPKTFKGGHFLNLKWLINNFPTTRYASDLKRYADVNSHIFWNISEWDNFYSQYNITFAFGTRFHGNMEAFRNGVPALWITHDSRTVELTEFLHLPHITINEFQSEQNMEQLIEKCDYNNAKENYRRLHKNYISYLDENNIKHNLVMPER